MEAGDFEILQIGFVALVLTAFAPVLLWIGLPTIIDVTTHTWLETQARVVHTEPRSYTVRGVETHDRRFRYEYTVEGRSFTGSFLSNDDGTRDGPFEPGATVDIYYAVESPELSRRQPTPTTNEWLTPIIGSLCLLFGPLLFWKRRSFASSLVRLEERLFGS